MKQYKKNGLTIKMGKLSTTATDEWCGRRRIHELDIPFDCVISSSGMSMHVSVPAGYKTDYATLPVVCQLVLGNRDDWAEIAVLHDWLCDTHVPYFICNQWMRSGLFCVGCPYWKRVLFFYGLMLLGYQSPIQRGYLWVKQQISSVWNLVRSTEGGVSI